MKIILTFIPLISFLFSSNIFANAKTQVEFLNSGAVFPTSLNFPFSEAVRVGNTLYISGQLGVAPGTLKLVEGGIKAEAMQTMNNIKGVLEANNLSMKNIVKCTVMLSNMSDWPSFNAVYTSFFSKPYPARSAFGVNGLGLGPKTEVECIAAFN